MRYLGGKSRIAKEIAAVVAPRGIWWEPFCGGLSVSVQLAKYGPGVVSDVNPALIALYQAVRDGWQPPTSVSKEEHAAAKLLPDSDPLKAFIGFGCSFGGVWFAGLAKTAGRNYAVESGSAVTRDIQALATCTLAHLSFFSVDPHTAPCPEVIYCDPPYAGTTGYKGTAPFSHDMFWLYCQVWANRGVRVFVSEYTCPVANAVVWQKRHSSTIGRGAARVSADHVDAPLERLFAVAV